MSRKSRTPVDSKSRRNIPAVGQSLVAHARNDITIPYYSGVLTHVDDTLIQRGGGKGLKIYDEIERDTHAFAMLQKRKKTLLARDWQVEPASTSRIDKAAALLVEEILNDLPFDQVCEDLLDATLKGYAVSEIIWARDGALIVPSEIIAQDQRRFTFDEDWQPRLLTWSDMRTGEELPPRKFMVHRFGVKGNNPYGLGLGSRLFWATLFKREGVTFWVHFLEKFAGPTVIGTTPYGTLTEEQQKFLNTLSRIRTSAAVALPVGSDVKFLEATRGGTVNYQDFIAYWDKQISICVTGETLTTDIGSQGSKAAATVHADILELLVDADADLLADSLKAQLLQWIVDYNLPGAGVPNVRRVRPENAATAAATRAAQAAATMARNQALRAELTLIARVADDAVALDILIASGVTADLADATVKALVRDRAAFSGPQPAAEAQVDPEPEQDGTPAFASWLKKKQR